MKAIDFLKGEIETEREYQEDEDADDPVDDLILAYEEIIEMIKKNQVKTAKDIEDIGSTVYEATRQGGMYGDTDLSHHIQGELANLLEIPTKINEASYHGPKAITKDSEIRYAVVDEDGVYFSESPGEGLAGAKLWKSERGARELAAEWGFAMRPRPKNKIVKVEIQTMMRRVD